MTQKEIVTILLFSLINIVVFLGIGWGRVKIPLLCAVIGTTLSWTAWFALGKQRWIIAAGFYASLAVLFMLIGREVRDLEDE